MKVVNKTLAPEVNLNKRLDALSQAFASGRFYGLEYILEDFFQQFPVKSPAKANTKIDWFGLYE